MGSLDRRARTGANAIGRWLVAHPRLSALAAGPLAALGFSPYNLWPLALAALASVVVAVPIGYLMSRYSFRGKHLVDGVLDIPIVLPPLVVGLSLLILFQTGLGRQLERGFEALFDIPVIVR